MGNLVDDFDREKCKLVQWPKSSFRTVMKDTGYSPITEDKFHIWWEGDKAHGENLAVDSGKYTVGMLDPRNPQYLLTREMNYHPDGSQIFYPEQREPFIMILGIPGDNIELENKAKDGHWRGKFAAFYFDGSKGVHLYPSVWHQPPISLTAQQVFRNKQAATHACVGYDSIREEKTWIAVHLYGRTE
jgi:hypothetical protein